MRRRLALSAWLAAVVLAAWSGGPARAGGADPAARLRTNWSRSNDAEREALLAAVVAAPSVDGFLGARDAAKSALELLAEVRAARKKLEQYVAEGVPPEERAGSKSKASDPFARDKDALVDLAVQIDRNVAGLLLLARAAGSVLDALPDAEFAKAAGGVVREVAKEEKAGFSGWVGDACGAARKDRTPPLLLDLAAEALRDQKRATSDLQAPAKRLDDVNRKIADALNEYLKARYAAGDYSGRVPEGLLGTLPEQKDALEREVAKIQKGIEGADLERRAAGTGLSRWIAGADPAAAAKGTDLVERRLFFDADYDMRALGLSIMAGVPGPRAMKHLLAAVSDGDPRIVVAGLLALAERDEPEALATLAARLSDERWRVRASAAEALAKSGRGAAVKPLVDALVTAKGRDLDDLRFALVALTGKSFPAAPGPWAAWYDAEGKDFRGPRDGKAAAAKPPAGIGPVESFPDEGGISFYGILTHSTRVLLVLDVSGSMNFPGSEKDEKKKKIDVLREEVRKTLTGLPDGATFNLIVFSTTVSVWKKDPQVRGSRTLAEAVEWFNKTDAIGSTNIHDALEQAWKLMGQGLAKDKTSEPAYDTVFLMTDGKPSSGKVTDPKLILGNLRRWNEARKVRLHVVGVGGHGKNVGGMAADDIDVGFLRDLAAQNGGQCVIR